ncbi:hypothetical protein BAC3_01334 [uncultured bacterium]|nr:hypothetical protein BAC3_01334 [uncultured bacterium]
MKRRHTLNDFNTVDYAELNRKTAMHEAGHAAAIYFSNRQRMLPLIFFRMVISPCVCDAVNNHRCITRIEGGRLIHTLPSSLEEATRNFSLEQQRAYRSAFEADIINLLVGSLAEANYVAQRDNELINPRLVPLSVLHNYGGEADLEVVQQYLDCFVSNEMQQEQKIKELFWQAFDFVSDWTHWYAITALANYILKHENDVIEYDEIIGVLEEHFLLAKKYSQRVAMF